MYSRLWGCRQIQAHQICHVADAELIHHPRLVNLDGTGANAKGHRDFPVVVASDRVIHHLSLSRSQRREELFKLRLTDFCDGQRVLSGKRFANPREKLLVVH